MRRIIAMDINNLVIKALNAIKKDGITSNSRCGSVKGLFDCELILTNPQNRHISLWARKYNIYASIAELIWVFSGDDNIDPLLSYFLKRTKDFSDDGKKWRGAYGPRLYHGKQISNIIHSFINEGITTRRAVFAIWTPYEDTIFSIEETGYGLKDIPCTLGGTIWISKKKLFLKLFMRSNDVIWGLSHINILEWTFFQELICYLLNNLLSYDVSLGYYHHSVTNLHCYERHLRLSDSILKSNKNLLEYNKRTSFALKVPYQKNDIDGSIKNFFIALSDEIVSNINNSFRLNERLNRINGIFDEIYRIEKERNLIYSYMIVIVLFIHFDNVSNKNDSDIAKAILEFVPEDLKRSMLYSKKTPHEINKILKEEFL